MLLCQRSAVRKRILNTFSVALKLKELLFSDGRCTYYRSYSAPMTAPWKNMSPFVRVRTFFCCEMTPMPDSFFMRVFIQFYCTTMLVMKQVWNCIVQTIQMRAEESKD